MTPRPALLFVYNADSGLFNTLADIGHKIFSPATYNCRLCAITHGYLTEREAWRDFVETLGADCTFLHRDEFRRRYADAATPLPAVFRTDGGTPECCADAKAIGACRDMAALQALIRSRCLGRQDVPVARD